MKAQTALGIFIAFGIVLLIGFSFFTPKAYAEPCNCFDITDCAVGEICDPDNTMCTVTGGNVGMCVAGGGATCTPACTGTDVCQGGVCVTPPTVPPGTDTGVATGVGDMTTCSGTTGCTGATCRWSKCATTADPTKIEFTFTIPNTCNGNSVYSGGRYVPANPCSTNAVSFPDSVKAAYANNCLYSIILTQVQADDYGKVCAGAGCSSSSTTAPGTTPGPPPAEPPPGGGSGCFVSGTPVMLADGSSKSIEEIKTGDIVRSFDPETDAFSVGTVTSTTIRDVQESYIIDFDDGSNVEVTGEHPFYVKTIASGVSAIHKYFALVKDLMIGDRVYKAINNQDVSVKITAIRQISKPVTVYNFNVEPFHTYIANGVMVHNMKPAAAVVAKPTFSITGFTTATGGAIYTTPGTTAAQYAPNIDATNAFDRANPQVSLWVQDMHAAAYGGASRTIGATFKVTILNPSPTQKCVMDSATGKPMLAPLCAGTTTSCTQTPTENSSRTNATCIDLTSQNGWKATGNATSKCVDNNQYRAMVTPQQYMIATCTKLIRDPTNSTYGEYLTNATTPGTPPGGGLATRNNWTTRTSCAPYGCNPVTGLCKTGGGCPTGQTMCSDGVCRTSCTGTCMKPPSLTSITASPRRAGPTGYVNMSSVASSSESVANGSGTRRMKVKLECGTTEGNIVNITPSPGGGGGSNCRTGERELASARNGAEFCDDEAVSYTGTATLRCVGNTGTAFITSDQPPAMSDGVHRCQGYGDFTTPPFSTVASIDCSSQQQTTVSLSGNYWAGIYGQTGTFALCAPTSPTGAATARPMFSVTGFATGLPCIGGGPDYRDNMQQGVLPGRLARLDDDPSVIYSPGFDALLHMQCINPSSSGAIQTLLNLLNTDITNGVINKPGCESGLSLDNNGNIMLCSDESDSYIGIESGNWVWEYYPTGVAPTTAGDPTGGSCQTGSFTANLCSGNLADNNPTCTFAIPSAWGSGGQKNIYCRVKDESGLYSAAGRTSVIVDTTPPVSQITEPAANSVQTANFQMNVTDTDESGLDKCYYGTFGSAIKNRTCNSRITITVGPGGDCPNQGSCIVFAFARDIVGNLGTRDSRIFNIKLISTNITAPADGSVQTRNFSVEVQDRDFTSATQNALTCTYDVYSLGSASTKTVDNAGRRCSSNFTVTVGSDGNCTTMGENSCRVVAKVNMTINGTRIEDTSSRFYDIDWVTPYSEIVSAPNNWVTSDFTISVSDNAQGVPSRISKCQYKVVSNGTQTRPWTDRTCGISSPVNIPITVGLGKDCRHEGGDACTIFVRPLDSSGYPGIEDNVSVPVIFNITDTDGFSVMTTTQTERGLDFSGTTTQPLRLYTFYVCNRNSNVNGCIAAYNSNNKGANKPNFCGSLLGRCDLRCSDQTVSYYFAARGTPVGQSTEVTVVSPLMSAACPTFKIETINEWYRIFSELDVRIGTEIGIVDSSINQNGETAAANNDTLMVLREALLITKDHLRNMTLEMQDLTVTRAQRLIQRSQEKSDEIYALLSPGGHPTRVTFTIDMPTVVRFNRSMDMTSTINKDGPMDTFGTVYCSITKPGNIVQQNKSSCLALVGNGQRTATYTVPFMPNRFGTWTYSCKLGRSVRPDCSFEVNQTPVGGTFAVMPIASTFISSLSAPDSVLKGTVATTDVVVTNPDSSDRFVNVTCNFKYMTSMLNTRRNSSDCVNAANGDTTVPINMYASTLGEWNVTGCFVRSSSAANCANSALDNTSLATASYMVILPDNVFIESVGVPSVPVLNNSLVSITANVNNPTADVAYATLNCGIAKPFGSVTVTDRKGIDAGRTSSFTLSTMTDYVGTWTINDCSVSVSGEPDFSNSVVAYTLNNVGSFNVVARTNLTITAVDVQSVVQNNMPVSIDVSVTNPSNSRYGRAYCTVTDPVNKVHANSSACLLVNRNTQLVLPVNFFANRTGEWHISQCSVYGSANADCSSYSLHDRQTFVDKSFNSTVSCTAGVYYAVNATGSCQTFGNNCDIPAGWTPTNNCPASPTNVYVASVTAPTSDVANNSNVNVNTLVINPINDDRFAQVSCSVKSPSGTVQTLTSTCEGIAARSSRSYRTTLLVNNVGLWNVTTCSVSASVSCASAILQHTLNASRTFNVVRGINMSFVSFSLPQDTLVNNTASTGVDVRNPSDAARYAKVSCSFRNPRNQIISNTTLCTQIAGTSVSTFDMNVYANIAGNWSVNACTLYGSLDSSCSVMHDSELNAGTFTVTTTSTCTPILRNATNPTTGECREFSNTCDIPAGWTTTGDCPYIPNAIRITAVLAPTTSVINNSNVNIDTTVFNSVGDDRFAQVSCSVRDPKGVVQTLTSTCEGITTGSSHTYRTSLPVNTVGLWNVTTCSVSASTSCSSLSLQHTLNAGRTFSVIRGVNLSFVSFTLPSDTLVNNMVALTAVIRNPSDAPRYARVFCSFLNSQNQATSNSTPCLQVSGTSMPSFAVNIFADTAGTWRADTCTLRGSLDSSCSTLHDTASNIGTFNITTTTPPPPVLSQLFISNISANPTALSGSQISVFVYGTNNNPANSSYALTGCDFLSPLGSLTRQASSCAQITANSTVRFSVSQLMNTLGTWTVRNCFINASSMNNCVPSLLHNVSTETRSIAVSLPSNLYITSVTAPATNVVNNTNVNIDVFVSNPLNDDKYGLVNCIIENPNGNNLTRTAACSSVPRQTSNKRYNVSLFANVVGSWNVRNCSVSSSTSSSCSGSSVVGELINGDTFNVIRGYNLTLSSLSVPQTIYINQPLSVAYTIRNPSTSDRFGRVTCTMTKGGQSIVNTSSCMTIAPESFVDGNIMFTPSSAGTWTVTCVAQRSFDSSCTSVEAHDTDSQTFNVTYPPDLFIQSVDVPSLALKDYEVFTTLRIRNTALTRLYGFAQCTFKNRLNETTYNASDCTNMTGDTTIINLGVTPALRGNWTVSNCYVNATPLSNCSSSRVHNISTTEKSFNVYAPVLSFDGNISLASSNLMVGDIADVIVNVKNTGERPYLTFVNCTLINPLRVSYMLTTVPQTLQIGETRDFHPQREVDVSGTWKVGTCSIYSISSPPKLEASKTVNRIFDVAYAASTDECSSSVPCPTGFTCENGVCVAAQPQCSASNCPGTKEGCYCSNDRCVSCGQGYTCSQSRCVSETPVINTCRSSNECTTGNVCVNGVCQQKPVECYSDNDCGTNYACKSGSCVVSVQKPLVDEKIIYFLIVLLAVIMVPIILFIYIKRAV